MFRLPKLPFELNALEPYISAETVDAHYNHHHRSYVYTLNDLIKDTPIESAPLDWIIQNAYVLQDSSQWWQDVYNNACQHFNHSLYWQFLGPSGEQPDDIGIDLFIEKAQNHFGDGWVVLTPQGAVDINDTGILPPETILLIDLWEHAYYLDRQWRKDAYIENFLKAVDWDEVTIRVRGFGQGSDD